MSDRSSAPVTKSNAFRPFDEPERPVSQPVMQPQRPMQQRPMYAAPQFRPSAQYNHPSQNYRPNSGFQGPSGQYRPGNPYGNQLPQQNYRPGFPNMQGPYQPPPGNRPPGNQINNTQFPQPPYHQRPISGELMRHNTNSSQYSQSSLTRPTGSPQPQSDLEERLRDLHNENKQLMAQLHKYREDDRRLVLLQQKQNKTLSQLDEELNVGILEISRLTSINAHYEEQLKNIAIDNDREYKSQIEALTLELESLKKENLILEEKLEELPETERILKLTQEELRKKENEQRETLTELELFSKEIVELKANLESKIEINERLTKEFAHDKERRIQLENQIANQLGTSADLVSDIEGRLESAEMKSSQFEKENTRLSGELAASKHALDVMTKKNLDLEAHCDEAEKVYDQMAQIINSEREKMSAMDFQLEQFQQNYQRMEEEKNLKINDLEYKLEEKTLETEGFFESLKNSEGGVDQFLYEQTLSLRQQITNWQQKELDFNTKINELRAEKDEMHKRLQEVLEGKLSEGNNQVEVEISLRNSNEELKAMIDELKLNLQNLEELKNFEFQDLKSQFDELVSKNFELNEIIATNNGNVRTY
ncbi:hypothetical protein HK099_005083 [Clydaea vesicula]|uniref:Uncharacterized protein n=1 Tax=Clydaea vesicula TaxID=447962 RepID=A0AAD5TZK6_9FUNG|nr:hypothetical protein HK099_005083 [Clydaea vesicula]KAJ3388182.1 hypothetical protein HDU92_001592 [Lobulomyces angularis]